MRIRKLVSTENPDILFIAKVSEALSHPVRVSILQYVLSNNEVRNDICNQDLVAQFPYSQATLSQHVKKMRDAGLFHVRQQNKYSMYEVNMETLNRYTTLLKLRRFKT